MASKYILMFIGQATDTEALKEDVRAIADVLRDHGVVSADLRVTDIAAIPATERVSIEAVTAKDAIASTGAFAKRAADVAVKRSSGDMGPPAVSTRPTTGPGSGTGTGGGGGRGSRRSVT